MIISVFAKHGSDLTKRFFFMKNYKNFEFQTVAKKCILNHDLL